jgi:dipeptidyl-peptidase 4
MKWTPRRISNALLITVCLAAISDTDAATETTGAPSRKALLEKIEPRMRAIYERGEFRAQRFRADWLPDSSGYVAMEAGPVRYDVATGKRTEAERGTRDRSRRGGNRSPDGQRVLLSERGNLGVRELKSGRTISITDDDAGEAISNGQAKWSPDGKRIAYVQSDRSEVRLRPMLIPGDPSYPKVRETRFARVGGAITQLKVGVVDATGGETRWLQISKPNEDFYLGLVEWAGNSNELLVEKLSRFRNQREFLPADVRSGKIKTIFSESDPAWVVASVRKNSGLQWIRNGRSFIVISEKDGWRHAYVYSREGKEERLLTPGEFDIIERVKIDEERGWYCFNASPDNGTQKYLYRARLDGSGKPERVTPKNQPGTHDYDFSPDGSWAFHTWSSFDSPPVTDLVEMPAHRFVRTLEDNRKLRAKMKSQIKQPTEFLELDIGNGVVMDAWMIKPSDFDPAKRYPVFVYVYGEPHAQTVLGRWGGNHVDYHRAIADQGYLVVSIDNRGTPAPKGAAWRRAVYRSLGPLSTEEQANGLKELARLCPYVDLSRVGIWGWSGGGSNTLNAMFRRSDVYHVGIAVAPKPQPHLYNAWFQEIYMDTRETNPEGYRKAAALNYADGLEGDLLIVHGSGETNTHLEIVEGLVDRLIELGKRFDFMTYPNRDHSIRKGKGTAVHLRLHMVRYLLNHLPPGPA